MRAPTRYFVVAKPGHYGAYTRVVSDHETLTAARQAAAQSPRYCVRRGTLARGDLVLASAVAEDLYPLVK